MKYQKKLSTKSLRYNEWNFFPTIRPKDKPMALQKALSMIHALVVTTFGLLYLPQFWNAEVSVAYECSRNSHPIKKATILFVTYLFTDIMIGCWKKTMKVDFFTHHIIFGLVAIIQIYYKRSCLPFTWLISGELSTIFLNIRWYLISTGRSYGLSIVNILFAFSFFATRCVLYGWGLLRFWNEDPNLWSSEWSLWLAVTPLCFSLGYLLNLWWFSRMIQVIRKGSKKE
jgi:hypothetical protein